MIIFCETLPHSFLVEASILDDGILKALLSFCSVLKVLSTLWYSSIWHLPTQATGQTTKFPPFMTGLHPVKTNHHKLKIPWVKVHLLYMTSLSFRSVPHKSMCCSLSAMWLTCWSDLQGRLQYYISLVHDHVKIPSVKHVMSKNITCESS